MENDNEKKILLDAIDVLTMDVLRLKSENETLRNLLDQTKIKERGRRPRSADIWSKSMDYLRREGFVRTIKKVLEKIKQFFGGQN